MKRNKKRRYSKGIPFGVDRLDKETMSEIKMFYSLCNDIEATAIPYRIFYHCPTNLKCFSCGFYIIT